MHDYQRTWTRSNMRGTRLGALAWCVHADVGVGGLYKAWWRSSVVRSSVGAIAWHACQVQALCRHLLLLLQQQRRRWWCWLLLP